VIYNDFDNYTERLNHIDQTNKLMSKLYKYVLLSKHLLLVKDKIPNNLKTKLIEIIEEHHQKYQYLDCITLSSNLLFSGKYYTTFEQIKNSLNYME